MSGSPAAGPEGELVVTLALHGNVVEAVDIASTRPHVAQAVLGGKRVEEALAIVPSLFSICGRSQAVAAQLAVAAARGTAPPPEVLAQQARSVESEIAQEYLWRALLDWPKARAEPPATAALALAREAVADGAGAAALRPVVEQHVLGESCEDWLDSHLAGFEIWIARAATSTARLLADVQRDGPRHGAGGVALLPPLTQPASGLAIVEALQRDPDFERLPTLDGKPAETGATARLRHQPLVEALLRAYGCSTLTRLVARLTELARVVAGRPAAGALVGARPVAQATGIGWAETARGLLLHWVELDGERVRGWRIVAPTEWNFHPRGALRAGLHGAHVDSETELRRRAEWLIQALDPCVSYRLEIRRA